MKNLLLSARLLFSHRGGYSVESSELPRLLELVRNRTVLNCGCAETSAPDPTIGRTASEYWFHELLARESAKVVGVDMDPAAIDKMKRLGFDVRPSEVESIDLGEKFDVVVARKLFEHLSNPGLALDAFRRHLSDQGILVLKVSNVDAITYRWGLATGRVDRMDFSNPLHVTHYNLISVGNLVAKHGFKVRETYFVATSRVGRFFSRFHNYLADDIFLVCERR